MDSAQVVLRFEHEFKNSANHGTVDAGIGASPTWVENHIYRVTDGQIIELWPAGGPRLG